ncbi:hypothetical protein N8796_03155 [Candidatus Pelagibacter sp.]|nr:hypothetical protein [Candidatus Pelagibacter sp.]
MEPDKIKNTTNYFSFKELSTPLADVKVSNYSGWSGLEVFKFFIPKGKSISSSIIDGFKTKLVSKEKIFFTTEGDIELYSNEFKFVLKKFDVVNFTNAQNYNFKSLKDSTFFMVSSSNSKELNVKSSNFNFINDIKKKDLWGGKIISRPYEGKELTLVLFEIHKGFKFHDKGHENEQITWLVEGEMNFYSDNRKKLLNSDTGVSIGANNSHGGISDGAIGFDVFFPKRIHEKYKND